MLESDLLSPESAQALCASRPFLLGMTTSLLQMTHTSLTSKLQEATADAFDYRYFVREQAATAAAGGTNSQKPLQPGEITGIVISAKERCLVESTVPHNKKKPGTGRQGDEDKTPSRFAGATEFFFLIAGLLRVSLFPGFRVDEEFQSMLRNVFASIQQLAEQRPSADQLQNRLRGGALEELQKCCSVAQGWSAFVDDPELSPLITSFSLMQLQWVADVAESSVKHSSAATALTRIPEWFVKLPAQWLARKYIPLVVCPPSIYSVSY